MSKKITINQHNGYEFVEIAGIKWATCNVGAEKPTDTGLYFQWGDRKGYTADEVGKIKRFDLNHYKHHNGNRWAKYTEFDIKPVLDLCDDAAFAYMGHGWRMPIDEEFGRLVANTTHRWTNNYHRSGVAGMVFIDITDKINELFFPAIGFCADEGVYSVGSSGYYWSGSLRPGYTIYGRNLYFNRDLMYWQNNCLRYIGFAIRGILTV